MQLGNLISWVAIRSPREVNLSCKAYGEGLSAKTSEVQTCFQETRNESMFKFRLFFDLHAFYETLDSYMSCSQGEESLKRLPCASTCRFSHGLTSLHEQNKLCQSANRGSSWLPMTSVASKERSLGSHDLLLFLDL